MTSGNVCAVNFATVDDAADDRPGLNCAGEYAVRAFEGAGKLPPSVRHVEPQRVFPICAEAEFVGIKDDFGKSVAPAYLQPVVRRDGHAIVGFALLHGVSVQPVYRVGKRTLNREFGLLLGLGRSL